MILPEKTLALVNESLNIVNGDPKRFFPANYRGAIYKSFGTSRFTKPEEYFDSADDDWVNNKKPTIEPLITNVHLKPLQKLEKALANQTIGDYVLGWLAILSTKYVLPIWENTIVSIPESEMTPKEIIDLAEQILRGLGDIENAYIVWNEYYYYSGTMGNFTNFSLASIYVSALYTFDLILFGANKLKKESSSNEEEILTLSGDCIEQAARAYSVIDKSKPGKWRDFEGRPPKTSEIVFDKDKRLEFWTWWLTEAIPMAWELAQTSFPLNK